MVINSNFKGALEEIKEEISTKIKSANEIDGLIEDKVDRDFEPDLWDFSPKELDDWMGNYLSDLNDSIDILPKNYEIKSNKKIIGSQITIVLKKIFNQIKAYTYPIFVKQRIYNDKSVRLQLANFIRLKEIENKLNGLEERISRLEEER